MWDKLTEFLSERIGSPAPFVVINQYEKGVILRWGKYLCTLDPGFSWKTPFRDALLTVEAVQTTMPIEPQTLTTRDDVSVTVSSVLQYEIKDPKPFLLEVWEGQDAINDITQAEIKQAISNNDWKDLNTPEIEKEILKQIRNQINEYGLKVKRFGFVDLGKIRTIRLISDRGQIAE